MYCLTCKLSIEIFSVSFFTIFFTVFRFWQVEYRATLSSAEKHPQPSDPSVQMLSPERGRSACIQTLIRKKRPNIFIYWHTGVIPTSWFQEGSNFKISIKVWYLTYILEFFLTSRGCRNPWPPAGTSPVDTNWIIFWKSIYSNQSKVNNQI